MKKLLLIISAAVVFSAGNVLGETHYVLPGDRIQTAVDQAEDGDTVVVLGGEYPHDVAINKNIKLKKVFGEAVSINGDLKITGLNKPLELNGFTLRGDESGYAVHASNCSKIIFANLNLGSGPIECINVEEIYMTNSKSVHLRLLGARLIEIKSCEFRTERDDTTEIINTGKCIIKNTTFQILALSDTPSEVVGCTMRSLSMQGNKDHSGSRVVRCNIKTWLDLKDGPDNSFNVFFQNTILYIKSGKTDQNIVFAYNKTRGMQLQFIGELKMVGNVVDGFYNGPDQDLKLDNNRSHANWLFFWFMDNNSRSKLSAYNNVFRNCREHNSISGIKLLQTNNVTIDIINNVIGNIRSYTHSNWEHGYGLTMKEVPLSANIKGNLFYDIHGRNAVHAPFDNVKVHNNAGIGVGFGEEGGYRGFNNFTTDAAAVVTLGHRNSDYRLKEGSKLIDAGPEEPWYFDLDGTRNDIGLYGGSNFDPDGFTTDKPVVLFSDQEPLQLIKGENKTINISAEGIVVP